MSSLLRLASLACSLVLIASFAMFVSDEARSGSKQTVDQIAAATGAGGRQPVAGKQANIDEPSPPRQIEKLRERRHGTVRELVDDGNDVLVAPFKGVVTSNSIWVQRGATGLIALLVFGLGLGFVARYASMRGT
jgi:hypothetical protein